MSLVRRHILFLCLLASQSAVSETITIAGWNTAARAHNVTPAIELRIAEGIDKLGADIVGLSEVHDRASLDRIADTLSTDYGRDYDVQFCTESERLHLAYLVSRAVSTSSPVQVTGTDLNNELYRQACAIYVQADEFDFVLINVHFKSHRYPRDGRTRVQQARTVSSFIRGATMFGERDVIVIGDYNMFPDRDQQAFDALSPTEFLRFLSTEHLCDSDGSDCAGTHISGNRIRNMLDGYAISARFTTEYVDNSFDRIDLHTIMNMSLPEFARNVADHLPLRAAFATTGPDDD